VSHATRRARLSGFCRTTRIAFAWEEWSASATWALLPLPLCDSGRGIGGATGGAIEIRPSR
jgi:hypothetical protein